MRRFIQVSVWSVTAAAVVAVVAIGVSLAVGQPVVPTSPIATSQLPGLSVTRTVRTSGGASDCTLIFTGGVLTGGSCAP